MTLGELKLECLKIMFEIESNDINSDSISNNPEYEPRLVNIMGSINRALARIDAVNKLPIKPDITHEYESDIEMWLRIPLPNNLVDTTDLKDYGLKDYLLQIVPYFVKADLFEEDDKGMSAKAFNVFEGFLNDLPTPPKNNYIRKTKPNTEETPPIITKHYNIYEWDK